MSTMSLRLPDSLHKKAREISSKDGISINQFVTSALAEKISSFLAEEYLEERAARGNRSSFIKVLKKVKNKQPDREEDTL